MSPPWCAPARGLLLASDPEVSGLAQDLRDAADFHEKRGSDKAKKPVGVPRSSRWNPATKKTEYSDYPTFDEVLATIRGAARWYDNVASLGYGIDEETGEED